ncbi:unnamed protein product [Cercospora beticola]|nr:unnamed protein product [Cercospora beticola]
MRFSTITTIALAGSAYAAPAFDIARRDASLEIFRREAEAGLGDWISSTARKWFMGFEKRDMDVDMLRREAEAGLGDWISNTARKWFMGFKKRDLDA